MTTDTSTGENKAVTLAQPDAKTSQIIAREFSVPSEINNRLLDVISAERNYGGIAISLTIILEGEFQLMILSNVRVYIIE